MAEQEKNSTFLEEVEIEVAPIIEVATAEDYDIQVSEAFPAYDQDLNFNHALLNNRELYDAHPISAITGLREELDRI